MQNTNDISKSFLCSTGSSNHLRSHSCLNSLFVKISTQNISFDSHNAPDPSAADSQVIIPSNVQPRPRSACGGWSLTWWPWPGPWWRGGAWWWWHDQTDLVTNNEKLFSLNKWRDRMRTLYVKKNPLQRLNVQHWTGKSSPNTEKQSVAPSRQLNWIKYQLVQFSPSPPLSCA